MLDIKFLRENPNVVKQNIKNKFQDDKLPLVDEVIALDAEARRTQQEADELRASRKKISKEIGALMAHIYLMAVQKWSLDFQLLSAPLMHCPADCFMKCF